MEIIVVDAFCGVGGLTHGFVLEEITVVAGIDSDTSCQYAYEHNNPDAKFIHTRIEDLATDNIRALYPERCISVLVGCAPCQPFSLYTKKHKAVDAKWKLLETFGDLIQAVQPDIIAMENVAELKHFKGGQIYQDFRDRLGATYTVTDSIVYCPDYGIPQKRRRLVMFASKFGAITLVAPTHTPEKYCTVEHAIKDLPPIAAGETWLDDPLHRASALSELNLRRIKQSPPGGTWRDWDEHLRAHCHMRKSGASYASVYGRMRWDEPSPTITTQCHGYGNGRFGHPEQDRAISLREAALLQTFPQTYAFVEPETDLYFATLGRHIGNAVPVDLGRVIARSIKKHVGEQHGR